ncbi:MAG: hypothetical protein AB8B99_11830 [Phormidesmis sp.]
MHYSFSGITFVGDEEKARTTPIKHDGVTFPQAAEAFLYPLLVVIDASRNDKARGAVISLDKRWDLLFL